jgi:sulfate adenylyltransferase subunit 2
MDVWQYIQLENIPLPSLYFSHKRECIRRGDSILANSPYLNLRPEEKPEMLQIRFRTIGDLTITGAVESKASTLDEIIEEISTTRTTERGTRADDKRSETSMEDRKKEGYF